MLLEDFHPYFSQGKAKVIKANVTSQAKPNASDKVLCCDSIQQAFGFDCDAASPTAIHHRSTLPIWRAKCAKVKWLFYKRFYNEQSK